MEILYFLLGFITLVAIPFLIATIIKPGLLAFTRVPRKYINRKTAAILAVIIFIALGTLLAAIEPESIKQARLEKERAALLASQKAEEIPSSNTEVEQYEASEAASTAVITSERDHWHKVVRVVDGDTVRALVDGKEEAIRIIGMDAPESTTSKECFGLESSNKAKEFLENKWIQLEKDETQDTRDKYGRLLRYVWFDMNTDFGRRMIEEGYAFEYTYQTPYKKQSEYKSTQEHATTMSLGLWSATSCSGTRLSTPAPTLPKPQSQPKNITTPKPTQDSSGVVKKSKNDICHAPGTTYYEKTTNFSSYSTIDACLNSGGRLPKR